MQKNVMIYGSCVSRDAFQEIGAGYDLLAYVARQSMISALSQPTALLPGDPLGSASQNRSLTADIKSSLMQQLRRHAADIDVLVIDLTDERPGVVALPDGSYVTNSHELVSSGRLEMVPGRKPVINVATERHWTLWESAANRFFKALTSLGLMEKTIVLSTPWAEVTENGEPVEEFQGRPTAEMNAYFGECCAHIRSLGYTVLNMPEDVRYAASDHKFGAATYHFGTEANSWIAAQIRGAANVAVQSRK
ncbi:DUF6270 domain-containing protein [Micrococcaceae bacterium Sec5.7]